MERISKKRFDLCVSIGRRFWTAYRIFRRHADINNVKFELNITMGKSFSGRHKCIRMSQQSEHTFSYNDLVRFKELFDCYDGKFYINAVKFESYDSFSDYYHYIFSPSKDSLKRKIYENFVSFVPLEINLYDIRIKDRRSGRNYISHGLRRHPLIEVIYYSDEMLNFIKKFTVDLACSPVYHLFEGCGGFSGESIESYSSVPRRYRQMFINVDRLTYDRTKCFKDSSNSF